MTQAIVTRWWWIRHAPVTTDGGRLYGQRDMTADVSDEGAFRALAAGLPEGAVWITTHLQRTRQTASAIRNAGLDEGEPAIVPELVEQGFGEWQGQLRSELFADQFRFPGFWHPPIWDAPPGGESFEDLSKRVVAAVARLTAAHAGRDIIAVTHGGTIRAAVAHALRLPLDAAHGLVFENLSVTRVEHYADPQSGRVVWRTPHINLPPTAVAPRKRPKESR